jgi:hypothetical protein
MGRGLDDTRLALARQDWPQMPPERAGVVIHDLRREHETSDQSLEPGVFWRQFREIKISHGRRRDGADPSYIARRAAGEFQARGNTTMTQQEELHGERGETTTSLSESVAPGRQRLTELTEAQAQLWDRMQDAHRKWLDRIQCEASMATDFANRLTAAKSFTETANLFQNWTMKHLEMATDDARQMLADTQQFVAAGARFWRNAGAGGEGKRPGMPS